MDLTGEEDRILNGDPSLALTKAMGILVNYGELQEAKRLIPIKNAHVSGVSYLTAGEALVRFLEDFVRGKGKAVVPSTLNPAGMDMDQWSKMGIPPEFAEKQDRIIELFDELGISLTCSCIPYEDGTSDIGLGDHLSWGESNAVIWANSIVGARTNREGGMSCLASALVGKTPEWGMHLPENRIPTLEVEVKGRMSPLHYDLLGALIGSNYNSEIAYFNGIRPRTNDLLKHLGAGLASKGGHAIFHIEGITPEHRLIEISRSKDAIKEKLSLRAKDLDRAKDEIYPESSDDIDAFVLGCPQFGPREFRRLGKALKGKHILPGKRILVFTSRAMRSMVDPRLIAKLEESGVEIYNDTCMVVTPLASMGFKKVGTDSAKAAHYIPNLPKVKAAILPLEIIAEKVTRSI